MTTDQLHIMNDTAVLLDPVGVEEYAFPATVGQQGFWFLDQIEPGNPAHNIALRFSLSGPLNRTVLERALKEIARRHEALRTTFLESEGSILQIVSGHHAVTVPVEDLRTYPDKGRRAEALMSEEAAHGFDLQRGPLIRFRLLTLDDREHILLLTTHQIVVDGWSTGIITRELSALYDAFAANRKSPLREPTLQFGDYAVWQSELLRTPAIEAQRKFWRQTLEGSPPIHIPHDESVEKDAAPEGKIESILIHRDLTNRLTSLSHEHGATLFMTCLACLDMLLHRRVGVDDIAVSTLVAGRMKTELESVVGKFANTLVLRSDLTGDPSFLELLERVRQTVVDALANQDLPFGHVLDSLGPQRHGNGRARFRIGFILQKAFLEPSKAGEVSVTPIRALSPGAALDLNFFMVEREEGWRVSCEYGTNVYLPETVQGLLREFISILEATAANPFERISRLMDTKETSSGEVGLGGGASATSNAPAPTNRDEGMAGMVNSSTISASTPKSQLETDGDTSFVAPRDETEARLVKVWQDVFHQPRISVSADFFDLGGHSLMAARLLMKIESEFGIRLAPGKTFENATVENMARTISGAGPKDRASTNGAVSHGAGYLGAADFSGQYSLPLDDAAVVISSGGFYQYLAVSDHWPARVARHCNRFLRKFTLPAPRTIFRPILLAFIVLRSVYFFVKRVFICEPLFKAYCESYGKSFNTGNYLHWVQGQGALIFGDYVTVDGKCSFTFAARFVKRPRFVVGNRTGIGHNCMFVVGKSITIGSNCAIASGTLMFDSAGHQSDPERRMLKEPLHADDVRPIVICDYVWIGRNVTICPGVTVGEGAVIASGSVVMTDVAPFTVVGGNPAGKIGESRPRSAANSGSRN